MKLLLLFLPLSIFAHMNIAVTYPYIGAITKSIGGEHINTVVLAKGNWDPHFVVPRPSLISKIRNADAIIINGAQLEIGWLPALLRRASNPKTNISSSSFLNLSNYVQLLNKPLSVDRSGGDIHPNGNPHFHLNPNNILILAGAIRDFLINLDDQHSDIYEKNYIQFEKKWKNNITIWNAKMKDKRGLKVIQFHNILTYFNKAYGIKSIGTIEPLPGIPPSSRHIFKIIKLIKAEKPCCILHDVYHSTKTAKYIQDKTGIKIIIIPHDIGALKNIEDLKSLFDYLTSTIQ